MIRRFHAAARASHFPLAETSEEQPDLTVSVVVVSVAVQQGHYFSPLLSSPELGSVLLGRVPSVPGPPIFAPLQLFFSAYPLARVRVHRILAAGLVVAFAPYVRKYPFALT